MNDEEILLCPFCGVASRLSELSNGGFYYDGRLTGLFHNNGYVFAHNLKCANASYQKESLWIYYTDISGKGISVRIVPKSSAKPQSDYIPREIIQDYEEACLILEDSPKASATLARRCLQAMIRDFHGIKDKSSLWEEIEALTDQEKHHPDGGLIKALHAVRLMGNESAHPPKDPLQIYDVSKEDAEKMIRLLETLFKNWYGAREQRKENERDLATIGEALMAEKKPSQESHDD